MQRYFAERDSTGDNRHKVEEQEVTYKEESFHNKHRPNSAALHQRLSQRPSPPLLSYSQLHHFI